ncbi:MAG: hypothetical protein HQ522_16345 [Bacteroidetes bacterium]|nr:hypothetical protein [Bacteroidota bacterium]
MTPKEKAKELLQKYTTELKRLYIIIGNTKNTDCRMVFLSKAATIEDFIEDLKNFESCQQINAKKQMKIMSTILPFRNVLRAVFKL